MDLCEEAGQVEDGAVAAQRHAEVHIFGAALQLMNMIRLH